MADNQKETPLIPTNIRNKIVIIAAAVAALFYPTLKGMYTIWMEDSNNSHGILVPFIGAYLVWTRLKKERGEFQPLGEAIKNKDRFKLLGLAGLVIVLCFYAASVLMDIVFFKNLCFVLTIQMLVLYLGGWTIVRMFIFPLFFLFFMVPVPVTVYGMVALPMQLFATKLTVWILGFTHLPVSANGNIIRIGNEFLTVAEACSGLRSLLTFVMISFLFAYISNISRWKRGLLVALSIPVAICGNILRLLFTSFVAYIYGSKIATGFIHDASGYVMFVLAFGVFLWLSKVLEGEKR